MLVLDTNILEFATVSHNDFKPEALELLFGIITVGQHCIAVDDEGKIVEREYKRHMKNNQVLITWWKQMGLRKKIKTRPGNGFQFGDLKEMDNCFACVSINTPDKILVSEDGHFDGKVKRLLNRRGVAIIKTDACNMLVCRNLAIDKI